MLHRARDPAVFADDLDVGRQAGERVLRRRQRPPPDTHAEWPPRPSRIPLAPPARIAATLSPPGKLRSTYVQPSSRFAPMMIGMRAEQPAPVQLARLIRNLQAVDERSPRNAAGRIGELLPPAGQPGDWKRRQHLIAGLRSQTREHARCGRCRRARPRRHRPALRRRTPCSARDAWPLCMMARRNNPRLAGDTRCRLVLTAPADVPAERHVVRITAEGRQCCRAPSGARRADRPVHNCRTTR